MSQKSISFSDDGALWAPTQEEILSARITQFGRYAVEKNRLQINTWPEFYRWSVTAIDDFWRTIWSFFQILAAQSGDVVMEGEPLCSVRWFPGASLNYAQNVLYLADCSDSDEALVSYTEDGLRVSLTWGMLREQVRVCAQAMRLAGLKAGDRVAAVLPSCPEATIAFLAASSIGAIWCCCSPDFGAPAVLDRFRSVEPKLLILVEGYLYKEHFYSCSEKNKELMENLSSVQKTVLLPCSQSSSGPDETFLTWAQWMNPSSDQPILFEQLPFDHPLCIVFTSGTTGVPKCIVHRSGGVLLQHLKEHALHGDIRSGDRVFYYTTCSWMMWNWLVSSLACGATVFFYDGYPFSKKGYFLFDMMTKEKLTHLGVSAEWLHHCHREKIKPLKKHDLSSLRCIFSTGSVLSPETFFYVYQNIKKNVLLASISGGTDILSCFVLSNPILPVFAGEIQSAGLGMAVQIFDEAALPCIGLSGELVCTRPFPSMPLGFWGEDSSDRYEETYFKRYPGVWHHGDFCEKTERGTFVMKGRSDSVLKPGGVRIGTAEIYNQLSFFPFIEEAVAVGQNWSGNERIILFLKLKESVTWDEVWIEKIKKHISRSTSPRHVPEKIIVVPDIPRTRNQKLVEMAVRSIVEGSSFSYDHSLSNPESLSFFKECPELYKD